VADTLPLLLASIGEVLATIRVADGFSTDIGARVIPDAVQRAETERPSVAYGPTAGTIDRTDEQDDRGNKLSTRARKVEFTIEAAVPSGAQGTRAAALMMLNDIECAFEARSCGAPPRTKAITLKTWSILDRPDGIDAVVLQILGEAEYLRQPTT
jgi:hypothetical protein